MKMKVFKFGGASLRHADAIRKVKDILRRFDGEELIVVVSAIGKSTNAMEKVVALFLAGSDYQPELDKLSLYHETIMKALFTTDHVIWNKVHSEFEDIPKKLTRSIPPDELYDQIVSKGEIISSIIVAEYLQEEKLSVAWVDARR